MTTVHTAECVTPKHPDKLCDRISDAVLDECLRQDPLSRVAMETMGGHHKVYLTGEITTNADIDYHKVVKNVLGEECNYDIETNIVKQSTEIAQGVDTGGAGDQGIMVGYACDENEEYMPQEYYLARKLCREIYKHVEADGKTQVTIKGNKVTTVVASFQGISVADLKKLVKSAIDAEDYHINPAGEWHCGGFDADTGVTGRKIVIDAYGPRVPVGGGAFSGKDPTKVDRSAAYMARRIAVDYLKKYQAREVLVKIAYAIGVRDALMAHAIVDGKAVDVKDYDLAPRAIIDSLDLRNQNYELVARWGHFGHQYNWDK